MSKYSLCKLLVRQAHKGSLMGHFRFAYIWKDELAIYI
jgi:hypothetical protein